MESEELGDVEKIQHLLMSMQSEEAKSIVTYASSGSYSDVAEALEKRFGRRRAVYLEHTRVLNSHNDLHDDRDEYIKRRQEITFHMRGLERCGKGDITGSQLLTAIQHMTMDAKVTAKWADFTDGLESPPGIDKLLEFMDKRITALGSNIKVKKPAQKPAGSSGQSPSKLKEKWKQSSFHLRNSRETSKDSCPVCGETHPVPSSRIWTLGKGMIWSRRRDCVSTVWEQIIQWHPVEASTVVGIVTRNTIHYCIEVQKSLHQDQDPRRRLEWSAKLTRSSRRQAN